MPWVDDIKLLLSKKGRDKERTEGRGEGGREGERAGRSPGEIMYTEKKRIDLRLETSRSTEQEKTERFAQEKAIHMSQRAQCGSKELGLHGLPGTWNHSTNFETHRGPFYFVAKACPPAPFPRPGTSMALCEPAVLPPCSPIVTAIISPHHQVSKVPFLPSPRVLPLRDILKHF